VHDGRGMNMRKTVANWKVAVAAIIASALLFSCCPISQNPLSDRGKAIFDKRLQGVWRVVADDFSQGVIHVGKTEGDLTKVISIENKEDGDFKIAVYVMYPTAAGSKQYMNIVVDEASRGIPSEVTGYMFAQYDYNEVSNTLSFSIMSMQPIAQAIASKKLKGVIKYNHSSSRASDDAETVNEGKADSIQCVTITDTGDNILKFIAETDPQVLFANKVTLERMR